MLVIVDERALVTSGYGSRFGSEGVSVTAFGPTDFREWVASAPSADMSAVEAFLIGNCDQRETYPRLIREKSRAPVIAMNEGPSLEGTLGLFAAGADDVVRKPIHVREILARVDAIRRRTQPAHEAALAGPLRVFFDGRDPEIRGITLALPRRERRILEYFAANRGRRLTKSQVFNSIYGIFDERIEETVVESHISKLRKKLRQSLGYDPIDSKRYLGYCYEPRVA